MPTDNTLLNYQRDKWPRPLRGCEMNDRRPRLRIREAPGCVQVFGLRCVSTPRPLRSQNGPITLENMNEPIIPGEILLEEYLKPRGISQNAMARAIGVVPRAINEIVLGRRSITPAMSIRFGAFFGQSDEFLAWNPN